MDKIIHIKQFFDISDDDFILFTKLTYPDHVQKYDKLHKSTCYTLKPNKDNQQDDAKKQELLSHQIN